MPHHDSSDEARQPRRRGRSLPGHARGDRPALEQRRAAGTTWRSSPSCTWSPRRASPSATTACSPTAPSAPTSRSSTSSPSLGSMAVQGPVIAWVADHRKHHAHTDVEGDPHSPHVGHGDGLAGVLRGLWHAHSGWLLDRSRAAPTGSGTPPTSTRTRACGGSTGASSCSSIAGLAIPALAGFVLTGTLARRRHRPALGRPGARLLRPPRHLERQLGLPLPRHAAASTSTTSPPTSSGSPSPRSASPGTTTTTPSRARPCTGCAGGSSTPRRLLIRGMEKVGLAWNVIRIAPERQAAKAVAVSNSAAAGWR